MNTPVRKSLGAIFFLFGFGIMAWIPRFPEVKQNLHLSNGQFGTLISTGSIGSVFSFLLIGHYVHRFGTRISISVSATALFAATAGIVHVSSSWQFLLCNIVLGAGVSAFHISINGQAFAEQERNGGSIIPRFHGLWAAGALVTAILSGFLTSRVSLRTHIDIVAGISYLLVLILLKRISSTLVPASIEPNRELSLHQLLSVSNIDWVMTLGLTCATLIEFAIGDWATIFSKEDLHMSAGVSTIPYILLMVAIISGRLTVHRIVEKIDVGTLVRYSSIVGSLTFMISVTLGAYISKSSPTIGFVIFASGTLVTGLGISYLAPTYFLTANKRSSLPSAMVLGQLGLIQTILIFALKTILAWTAQLTSISVALLLPGAMLLGVALTAPVIRKANI